MGPGPLDAVLTGAWRTVLVVAEGFTEASAAEEGALDSVDGREESPDGATVVDGRRAGLSVTGVAEFLSDGPSSCRYTTWGAAATECRHKASARQRRR